MKRHINLRLILFAGVMAVSLPMAADSNVAYRDGKVRITVVADGLCRLEYAPDGAFTDAATAVAVNRDYPKAWFSVKDGKQSVVVTTRRMVVKYIKGTGPFSPSNLSIVSAKGAAKPFKWVPGQQQKQNLKGTTRTLDGFDGTVQKATYVFDCPKGDSLKLEDGLLARDGWTLIDDTHKAVFDNSTFPWLQPRDCMRSSQDWYFMAYGTDYKQALKDFTLLSGKMPMPPRFAFGFWWSRYWSYSDHELRQLVDKFHRYDIPLSVLVVDIDWHWREKGKGGWTGMSFNTRLFPDPPKFMQWLKDEDLKITLNLHPGAVEPYEDHYEEMAKWMGVNPADRKPIAWNGYDKKFMGGWINTQLRPLEKWGVDFWWIDWQSRGAQRFFPNMTWMLNYSLYNDMAENRKVRPFIYGRWGGLGNHRYPMGFSGDAIISWASLDFQPYFNSTASNVLYGYWSNDIGGHMMADRIDPEMYVRWMQFGALSPFLRVHTSKETNLVKEPWLFSSNVTDILHDIINERYNMVPYIYAMARKAYDTGLSLCRPMYYDYPERAEAYDNKNEYMFGDNMLVCPITAPMTDGISEKDVWLPSGNDWYEVSTGTLLKGGQTVKRRFQLAEYPLYVKAGSILPAYSHAVSLNGEDQAVTLDVYPGGNGSFSMYEDNGNDRDYAAHYATTPLACQRTGRVLKVSIGSRTGNYEGMPQKRKFTVKVHASACPESVTVDGTEVPWRYLGNELALEVELPVKDCSEQRAVEVTYPENVVSVSDGLLGAMRHTCRNIAELKNRWSEVVLNDKLGKMGSLGEALQYYPDNFNALVSAFRDSYSNFADVLRSNGVDESLVKKLDRMK